MRSVAVATPDDALRASLDQRSGEHRKPTGERVHTAVGRRREERVDGEEQANAIGAQESESQLGLLCVERPMGVWCNRILPI